MSDESAREDVQEELAQQYGCADGSCGYDFDEECYWWLQGKIEEEIERRERQNSSAYKLAQQFRESIKWNYEQMAAKAQMAESVFNLYNDLQVPLDFAPVKNVKHVNPGQPLPIVISAPAEAKWDLNHYSISMDYKILQNMNVFMHGGPMDGKKIHIMGFLDARIRDRYRSFYRLVLLDGEPHYFYEPEGTSNGEFSDICPNSGSFSITEQESPGVDRYVAWRDTPGSGS